MPEYLVSYDYGQGGIWLYLYAENAAQIARAYPSLKVFETAPDWWTEELETAARKNDPHSPFWRDWLSKREA